MASTPPPLPSSSEDSDFDDDDFGCFKSSVPSVKTIKKSAENDVRSNVERDIHNTNRTIEIRENEEKGSLNDSETNTNSKKPRDCNHIENSVVSDETNKSVPQLNDVSNQTASSTTEDHTATSAFRETEQNSIDSEPSDFSQTIPRITNFSQSLEINSFQLEKDNSIEDESVSHSSKLQSEKDGIGNEEITDRDNTEQSVTLANDAANNSNNKDIISESRDNGVDVYQNERKPQSSENEMVDKSSELSTVFCNGKKEEIIEDEDDIGDWSDMKSFDATNDEMKGSDANGHQTLNSHGAGRDCSECVDAADDKNQTIISNLDVSSGDIPSHSTESLNKGHILADNNAADEKDCVGNDRGEDSANFKTNKDDFSDADDKKDTSDFNLPPQEQTTNQTSMCVNKDHTEPSIPNNDIGGDSDDEEEDFGDFADFSSPQGPQTIDKEDIPPVSFKTDNDPKIKKDNDVDEGEVGMTRETEVLSVDSNNEEEDEDWGFKSAANNSENQQGSEDDFGNFGKADNNGEGDWASFNDTSTAEKVDSDDDFDDFSGSDFQAPPCPSTDSPATTVKEGASKVEKVVFLCFPNTCSQQPNTSLDEPETKPDNEAKEVGGLSKVVEMGLNITPHAKEETWTIVKEMRNKDPVVGTWSHLKDVNSSFALNYGWNSSHCCQEIFSTLHIDTKNVLFSQKKQAVPFYASGLGILEPIRGSTTPAEKNQTSGQPNLLETDKSEENTKKVLDIPPVDFDWGSSGLTNPLKVFKAENFNTGLSSLESFSDVLQKNLEPTKELSEEAKSILSKIPNLNFMRSKVLMFPIKD